MKKLIIISAIAVLASFSVKAQQLPMYSQYMFNGFLLNPAVAGTTEHIPIRLTARQQWLGIEGAPQTMALSGHMLFSSKKVGAGGYLFHDQFGPVSRTGLLAAYSYHLDLPSIKSKLALGLSAVVFQYQLRADDLIALDLGDPAMTGARQTAIVPDANFGAYLHNSRYFVGVAATQLIQLKMNLGDYASKDTRMVRHYFVTGGYQFVLNDDFELEPSVLLKATERTPMNMDINAKVIFKKSYWLGVSYRSDKDLICLLGVKSGRFVIGYAFDYPFSPLQDYTSGTHELMIGFDLGGKEQGSSLL